MSSKETGKEIAVQTERKAFALLPQNIQEGMELAAMIAKSDLAPKDFKGNAANCFIAMQMGAEVGLSPMQAIQNIAVINGRPSVWGDSMLAICQAHRDFESINENESTDEKGVCVVKRRGMVAQRREFSLADAKSAGLFGKAGPWTNYRARMLKLRARAFALRDTFGDALRGLQSAEEVSDYVNTDIVQPSQAKPEIAPPLKKTDVAPPPAADAVALNDKLAQPDERDPDQYEGFFVEVKKFRDAPFQVICSDGVVLFTGDEELAKKAKSLKGKDVVYFCISKDAKPWLVGCDLKAVPA